MQQQLFLLIILLQCLLITIQPFSIAYEKIQLDFYYASGKPPVVQKIRVITRPFPINNVNNSYILIGEAINDQTFVIKSFECMLFQRTCECCRTYFESML